MSSSQEQNPQIDHQEVLAELEESLLQRPNLDAAERETMMRHFETALQQPGNANGAIGPDRNAWIQTLELLKQENVIAQEDGEALLRHFDEAMDVVQNDTLKLAAELAAKGDGAIDPQTWQARRAASASAAPEAMPHGLPSSLSAPQDRKRR
jgi:hypothetical protein